jgi:hypothetical protein
MMGYGVIKRYGFSLFCLYGAIVLGLAACWPRRRDV